MFEKGKKYLVKYIDPQYPCDCLCHTEHGWLHVTPCCSNKSWTRVLYYVGMFEITDENSHVNEVYYEFVSKNKQIKKFININDVRHYEFEDKIPKPNKLKDLPHFKG